MALFTHESRYACCLSRPHNAELTYAEAAFSCALILNLVFARAELFKGDLLTHEFFPSIQDTITAAYPFKPLYQISIAIFSLVNLIGSCLICTAIHKKSSSTGKALAVLAIVQHVTLVCFSCISVEDDPWSSSDCFVLYIISTLAWIYVYQSKISSKNNALNRTRKIQRDCYVSGVTLAAICHYKHQVELARGWYSAGAIIQWGLIGIEVYFNYSTRWELRDVNLEIVLEEHKRGHLV